MPKRPLDIDKLFKLNAAGALSLEQKISLLQHYGIKVSRRDLARSLLDIIGESAASIKQHGWIDVIENATGDQMEKAAAKIIDRQLKIAESLFRVHRTEEIVQADLMSELGTEKGKTSARNLKYKWKALFGPSNPNGPCEDCEARHKMKAMKMDRWRAYGLPRTGATRCRQYCHCRLVPVIGGKETDLII